MIGRGWLASQEAASTCGLSEISLFVSLRNYRGHARRFASPPLSLMIGKNLRRRTNRVNQADVRGNAYRVLLFYRYVPGNRLAFEPGQKVGPWKAQRLLTARQVNVCVITKETDVPSVSGWMSPSMQSEEPRSRRTDLFNSHSNSRFHVNCLRPFPSAVFYTCHCIYSERTFYFILCFLQLCDMRRWIQTSIFAEMEIIRPSGTAAVIVSRAWRYVTMSLRIDVRAVHS